MVKVFDEKTFATTGDKDEGDMGVVGRKDRELMQEMTTYTAGTWKDLVHVLKRIWLQAFSI